MVLTFARHAGNTGFAVRVCGGLHVASKCPGDCRTVYVVSITAIHCLYYQQAKLGLVYGPKD